MKSRLKGVKEGELRQERILWRRKREKCADNEELRREKETHE